MTEKLSLLVISDPAVETGESLAPKFEGLAEDVIFVGTGKETVELVRGKRPEILLLSLEIQQPTAQDVLAEMRRASQDVFIIATYRELSVQGMKKLGKFGIGEFAPHPVDVTALYRAASRHFGRPFRRHTRHQVSVPVTRVDGTRIGITRDLSEGGMLVALDREVTSGMSQLLEIGLEDGQDKPLRVRCVVLGVDVSEGKQTAARVEFDRLLGPDLNRLSNFLQTLR